MAAIAFVGCGGKTALIKRLAKKYRKKSLLVAPTTKMYPPDIDGADVLGKLNPNTGKLEAVPPNELAQAVLLHKHSLLEADGSRGLPCKGWQEYEPVVPAYCTHTVGVITLAALGLPATEERVHRLSAFLALTGLRKGDAIGFDALLQMVLNPQGMFKNSAGRRILFVNQVEDEATEALARQFLSTIKAKHKDMFARLYYGSAHEGRCALFE